MSHRRRYAKKSHKTKYVKNQQKMTLNIANIDTLWYPLLRSGEYILCYYDLKFRIICRLGTK